MTVDSAATEERFAHLRLALAAYDSAGFLVGPPEFPVVGRAVVLAGPDDSVFVGFAASMPPSALQFAREQNVVSARYQVTMHLFSGTDTIARVDRREVVRVADFPATTEREPRIVFQRFVPAPTGRLTLDVTVRELTSRRQARGRFNLEARRGLSPPLLAYHAEVRSSFSEPPELLLDPRNTVSAVDGPSTVLLEDATGAEGAAVLRVEHDGVAVWSDSLLLLEAGGGPVSAVTALPVHRLPPGRATILVRRASDPGTAAAAPLYVGLSPEWVLPSWEESLAYLAYEIDPDTLEAWRQASAEERSFLWQRFRDRTDPEPDTPVNEFVDQYFDRMSIANERFDEPGRAGWETDRGQVLVKLGEPDGQSFHRPQRQGEVPRIEWEYDESVPTPVLIAFEDATDFGVFVLTPRSRVALRRVVEEVRQAEGRSR